MGNGEIEIKVDTSRWEALLTRVAGLDKMHVRVGILASKGGSAKPDGSDVTIVDVAAMNEYGSIKAGVSERPFMRPTLATNPPWLVEHTRKLTAGVMMGRFGVRQAYEMLGSRAATEVRNAITAGDGIPPPNAPATVRRKKSRRPLVDKSHMLNAITHEVVGEGVGLDPPGSTRDKLGRLRDSRGKFIKVK